MEDKKIIVLFVIIIIIAALCLIFRTQIVAWYGGGFDNWNKEGGKLPNIHSNVEIVPSFSPIGTPNQ